MSTTPSQDELKNNLFANLKEDETTEQPLVDESIKKEEEEESKQVKNTEPEWVTQLRKEEQGLKQLILDSNCEIDEKKNLTLLQIQELYSIAKKEHQHGQENQESGEGEQFEKEFVEKGTIVDKIAALSLLVQQKPIYRLNYIDELVKICHHPKNHRAAELAVKTCTDLFQNLLISNRELYNFKERVSQNNEVVSIPAIYQVVHHFEKLNNKKKKKENLQQVGKVLAVWYFEELLKKKYHSFINDVLAENIKEKTNTLDVVIIRTMRNIRDLIKGSPEKRETLISLLVTKFADTKTSINARALYYLTGLVNSRVENNPHYVASLDKMFLCKTVCEFLMNTKMDASKRGFAASFLNNMVYTPEQDSDVADYVLKTTVQIFNTEYSDLIAPKTKKNKKQKDEKQSTVLNTAFIGSLLSSMFKAFRHIKSVFSADKETIDLLFKVARVTPLTTSVCACKLIYAIAFLSNDERTMTRFYTLLYDKLLDEGHTGSKAQNLLLVVYETVREDLNINRVGAFCKRLLQSCFTCSNPGYAAAVLMVIDQILKVKPAIFMGMIEKKNFFNKDGSSKEDDEEEEETFDDIDDEEDIPQPTKVLSTKDDSVKLVGNQIVIAGYNQNKTTDAKGKTQDKKTIAAKKARGTNPFTEHSEYDPTSPKPEKCNAMATSLWELNLLKHQFHPSVSEFVDSIITKSGHQLYKGNPIVDFSTTAFIDKLMFKPFSKKANKEKGSGLFAKSKAAATAERLIRGTSAINSKEFAELPDELVKSDERFFHTFMVEKFKRRDEVEKEKEAKEEKKKAAKEKRAQEKALDEAMDEDFSDDDGFGGELEDEQVMELLGMEGSDDEDVIDDEDNGKEGFGFDVTQLSEKPSQDEIAQLIEDDEDEILENEKDELKQEKNPSQGKKKGGQKRKKSAVAVASSQNKNATKKQKRK